MNFSAKGKVLPYLAKAFSIKNLLIMKLIVVLLVVTLVQVSAKSFSQITLREKNAPLEKVLSDIEAQSNYVFLFSSPELAGQSITVEIKNGSIQDVLKECFKSSSIDYRIVANNILLKHKTTQTAPANESNQEQAIHGSVKDGKSQSLPGVTIINKRTKRSTSTDSNGLYSIEATKGDVLVFSFIGFRTKELTVNDEKAVNVVLEVLMSSLDDVVIVGYGSTTKKDLTGSVSTVSAKDIENIPFNTVDNALAGKAAGVQVTKSDGSPGGAVRIRIRGSSSLLGGNDPLYVIDGVPVQIQSNYVNPGYSLSSPIGSATAAGAPTVSNTGTAGISSSFINGLNNLGGLNPDDIESITILKDASSTGIYGSKAANGVVIITTKRGKNDMKPGITASYYSTLSTEYNTPKLLDATQYKTLLTEAAKNQVAFNAYSGFPLSQYADLILNGPSTFFGNANTNWIKEVTHNAISHNAEISVQGGSPASKYFSSVSYNSTPGVVKGTDFQRVSGKLNIENNISNKFKFITNLILGYTDQNIGDNAYAQALVARPDISPYDASGNYLNFDNMNQSVTQFGFANPLALLTATNSAKTVSLLGSLSAIYDITKDLQFKSSGSLNYTSYNQRNFTPSYLKIGSASGNVANKSGIGGNSNRRIADWFIENTLTYNKRFNENNSLNVLVGQSYETYKASFFSATATGYPNDDVLNNLSSAVTPLYVRGDDPSKPQSYLLSFYARANYSLLNKYLFTFTGRTDGSSKFGTNNKFGYFPSGAVAWRISQEKFLKNQKWIDDIKIRGSYGLTGNQNIGDQMYRTLYSPYSYAGVSALVPTQLGNDGIKWESTREADAGIDISLLNNRVTATVDYYHKQTNGDLLSFPVAPSSSYTSLLTNAVGIRNTGLEITVGGDIIRSKDFKWTASVNTTFSKSIVTHLDPSADLTQIGSLSGLETLTNFYGGNTALIQGQPLGILTGQYVEGIIKTQAEADAYRKKLGAFAGIFPSTIGDPMFRLDPSTAAKGYQTFAQNQIIGYGSPKYFGGITQGFVYKKFDLQFYFTYSVGGHLVWGDHAASDQFQGISNLNASALGRYYPGNPNASLPQLVLDYYSLESSNLDVFSSSYLKLRTLSFSYDLSQCNFFKKAGMKNASLFVSATNVFTITKYPGNDPEVSDDPFSVTGGYFDVSNYPSIRSFSIGIKAGF
jgi:TonB-linked SusC/RagA family outer membrane protein